MSSKNQHEQKDMHDTCGQESKKTGSQARASSHTSAHGHMNAHGETNSHEHTLLGEFMCHFPHAVFSVLLSLIVLSVLNFIGVGKEGPALHKVWDELFHNFHFMHIVFAAIGTLLTFFKYSRNFTRAIILGFIAPSIFCVLSDIIFPYVGASLLGVHMHLHICFWQEQMNVIPFLVVGVITGLVLGMNSEHSRSNFSSYTHFLHIFVSSLASSFYMVAHGFTNWPAQIGSVFLVLIIAVVVPCTLSDVVIPMIVARFGKGR